MGLLEEFVVCVVGIDWDLWCVVFGLYLFWVMGINFYGWWCWCWLGEVKVGMLLIKSWIFWGVFEGFEVVLVVGCNFLKIFMW